MNVVMEIIKLQFKNPEGYLELSQASKMDLYAKIVFISLVFNVFIFLYDYQFWFSLSS